QYPTLIAKPPDKNKRQAHRPKSRTLPKIRNKSPRIDHKNLYNLRYEVSTANEMSHIPSVKKSFGI
ncbi:MAG: hypothetical protein POG24_11030, partial [Acidocella sp.]|nr:hypothetical protein [Acidocella sp.]